MIYHIVLIVHLLMILNIFAVLNLSQLEHDIDALLEWSKLWLLSFNISKCKHLRIGLHSYSTSYTLDGIVINQMLEKRLYEII